MQMPGEGVDTGPPEPGLWWQGEYYRKARDAFNSDLLGAMEQA